MNIKTKPTYIVYANARRKNFVNSIEFLPRHENELLAYCQSMVNAIIEELQQQRHCWLIDQAFSSGSIFSVDWAIIQALRTAQGNSNQLKLAFPPSFQQIPVSDNMESEMLALHLSLSSAKNNSADRNAALSSKSSELERQISQASEAKNALETRITQLKKEAESLQSEYQKAQSLVQNQLTEAESKADAIVRKAYEMASDIRAELLHGAAIDDRHDADATQPDGISLRNEVETETRRLENTIRTSLDSYRDEIYRAIYEFRTGLYKYDYTTLCFAYQKLYLFATVIFDKRIEALCAELSDETISQQVQNNLRKMQGQLIKRVTVVEDSFRKLGLTVFRPEKGEEYNDVYHAAENAEDDGYLDATVRYCVCPGIRTDEQVLCRAAVMVDTAEYS